MYPAETSPQPQDTRLVSWAKITQLIWQWRGFSGGAVNAANEPQPQDNLHTLYRKSNGILQEIADNP